MEATVSLDGKHTEARKFHGVYLLFCLNVACKGRTYIGYTVNPQRRIKQHNLGKQKGGARKTSGKGPWEMVLIIHGFPNDVAGLRFEWAWQHPRSSRRLRHVERKKKNERDFDAKIRILAEMLRTGPWNRLPLTIQWLNQDYVQQFPINLQPPVHMPISYGPIMVKTKKRTISATNTGCKETGRKNCGICKKAGENEGDVELVDCCNAECIFKSHVTCLAETHQDEGFLVPITINCPKCGLEALWSDIVFGRKKIAEVEVTDENEDEEPKNEYLSESEYDEEDEEEDEKEGKEMEEDDELEEILEI